MKLGLLVRRECWTLSFRGKLLVLGVGACLILLMRWGAHPFLAVNSPLDSDVLVVEGWIPLHVMDQVEQEFKRGRYQRLILMRTRHNAKESCNVIDNASDYTAHLIVKHGVPNEDLQTLSCYVGEKDRTYQVALGLKEWLAGNETQVKSLNVATIGPHARRSWLTYKEAFGNTADIGIVALKDPTYNPNQWWRTTKGVREVPWETIAYVYARFFFVWP